MSCPQIWNIEKEKDREKEKLGRQASEAQREKELERETIFCWRNSKKFCSGRMLAATRVKMSDKEKKLNKNTSDISFIKRVTRTFHVVVVQDNAKEMYNEKVCCTCKVTFLLIRPIVVFFYRSRCVCHSALYDFIFCFSKL